jgi:alkylated DNA repair dioxygenase AlkB
MTLFSSEEIRDSYQLPLPDAEIRYFQNFFNLEESEAYFTKFLNNTPWQQDSISLFGKTYEQPRLTALFGDKDKNYNYSGITMKPHLFTKDLTDIKNKIEKVTHCNFNAVLLNLYRDGNDSNGWHSDNEKELGTNPVIASVSFGASRKFQLRHRSKKEHTFSLELENGSLLLMTGPTQHFWQHQIPKTKKHVKPRINLTFRFLY